MPESESKQGKQVRQDLINLVLAGIYAADDEEES